MDGWMDRQDRNIPDMQRMMLLTDSLPWGSLLSGGCWFATNEEHCGTVGVYLEFM